MWDKIKEWGNSDIERTQPTEVTDTKETHEWIARIWTPDTIKESTLVCSVPYATQRDMKALKRALKASKTHYKVTEHKVELSGEYIIYLK